MMKVDECKKMTWDGAHGFVKEKKWFYKRKEKV
jgi:hypothetical protein